jgi:hypothetical protein
MGRTRAGHSGRRRQRAPGVRRGKAVDWGSAVECRLDLERTDPMRSAALAKATLVPRSHWRRIARAGSAILEAIAKGGVGALQSLLASRVRTSPVP